MKDLYTMLNTQMTHEMDNFRFYKNLAGIADFKSLLGAVNWFEKQADEELGHFKKIYEFLCDKNVIPTIEASEAQPVGAVPTLLQMFERAAKKEKETTTGLQKIYDAALTEKDGQVIDLLEWFLKEQVEEEKVVGDVVNRLRLAGEEAAAVLVIDNELKAR